MVSYYSHRNHSKTQGCFYNHLLLWELTQCPITIFPSNVVPQWPPNEALTLRKSTCQQLHSWTVGGWGLLARWFSKSRCCCQASWLNSITRTYTVGEKPSSSAYCHLTSKHGIPWHKCYTQALKQTKNWVRYISLVLYYNPCCSHHITTASRPYTFLFTCFSCQNILFPQAETKAIFLFPLYLRH